MNKTVGICTVEKFDNREFNSFGSSRIRARWLIPYWNEAEEYIIGKEYKVLIFQKVYWKAMMNAFKGIKILDLCDPDWLEGKPVLEFVDYADATVTSTEALATYIKKLRPKALVRCIPDRVYLSEATPVKTKHSEELKKLVWFGYSHNSKYLYSTFDILIEKKLSLTIISNQAFDVPLIYRDKVKIIDVPYSYATVNKEIIKCDAVLMPDERPGLRGFFKSNNKVIQSWALGMPIIRTPEDLERFSTKEAREKEGLDRRKEIEDKWDVRFSVDDYKVLINEIKKKKIQ